MDTRRSWRPLAWFALVVSVALSSVFPAGCNTVEFYEMEAHASEVMSFTSGPARVHLEQKVLYSMEGSAGGIGTSAGGGCGCY